LSFSSESWRWRSCRDRDRDRSPPVFRLRVAGVPGIPTPPPFGAPLLFLFARSITWQSVDARGLMPCRTERERKRERERERERSERDYNSVPLDREIILRAWCATAQCCMACTSSLESKRESCDSIPRRGLAGPLPCSTPTDRLGTNTYDPYCPLEWSHGIPHGVVTQECHCLHAVSSLAHLNQSSPLTAWVVHVVVKRHAC
jgi:hypothetical protein